MKCIIIIICKIKITNIFSHFYIPPYILSKFNLFKNSLTSSSVTNGCSVSFWYSKCPVIKICLPFLFEIIESNIENYNERETYWINFYQANNPLYGYNLTEGGEDPPLLIGAKNNNYKYSDELVSKIRYDIKYTDTPFKDLAIKYKCPESFINSLNIGKTRKDKSFNYPIRKSQKKINDSNIFFDLMNTTLSIQDIVKKYNSTIYVVYAINEGKRYGQDDTKYPIRIRGSRFSSKILEQIKIDLKNNIPKTQIAKKYNIGRGVLYRAINNYIGGVWYF